MRIYSADQSEEVVNLITAPMTGAKLKMGGPHKARMHY